MGFLYYYGIKIDKNKDIAFEYFKKAAKLKDEGSLFACFCLAENDEEKYKYFG